MSKKFSVVLLLLLMSSMILSAADAKPRKRQQPQGDQTTTQTSSTSVPQTVVMIVTDDMARSDFAAMPNTRRILLSGGTTFPNFTLNTPVCCPDRATKLTGLYTRNHGTFGIYDGPNGGDQGLHQNGNLPRTIAAALDGNGWRTALVGKYLNDYTGTGTGPLGWDDWYALHGSQQKYFDITLNENGTLRRYQGEYASDVMARRASRVVRDTPASDSLFLYFAPIAPHSPSTPALRHRTLFANAQAPRDASFLEADVSDKPAYVRNTNQFDAAYFDASHRDRLRTLVAVDEGIKNLWDTLVATGRADNAHIFFATDNGYLLGQHGWRGKSVPYDRSTRVSMLARGPSFAGGARDERFAASIDLAPTIADIAGVPFQADGRSLLGPWDREGVVMEMRVGGPRLPTWDAIRTPNWLYVEYGTGEKELYDRVNDPLELQNLLADWGGHTPTAESLALGEELSAQMRAAYLQE